MKTVAVICEYNPFHRGHAYQFDQIRKKYGNDCAILALMSGNYVQRGEPASFQKFNRAKAALLSGANLVLEFPYPFCVSGANYFARNAIHILNSLGIVDVLSFGFDCNDETEIEEIASVISSASFASAMQTALMQEESEKIGYAQIRENVLLTFLPHISSSILKLPNTILAVEYRSAIALSGSKMKPHFVKRTSHYHADDVSEDGFASASYIRKLLIDGKIEDARDLLPKEASAVLFPSNMTSPPIATTEILGQVLLAFLRVGQTQPNCFECNNELLARLKKAAIKANNYDDLIKLAQTKRYTATRVKRAALHCLLGTSTQDGMLDMPAYTQVLASDAIGMALLKNIKKKSTISVLTKPADFHQFVEPAKTQAQCCAKADALYTVLAPENGFGDTFLRYQPYFML